VRLLDSIKAPADLRKLSYEQLAKLSDEIRKEIINRVSKNGGHLSGNLGVVELTIALHRIFNSPYDQIIWDVGHQCYTHKILTGRLKEFETLRRFRGMSGFPSPEESVHDTFVTGHSSTSISLAQGMAISNELKGEDRKTIAVIGDGAMTSGMALEALNYSGHLKMRNLIVILNDNEMSISKNIGGMADYLHKLRLEPIYTTPKDYLAYAAKSLPGFGNRLYNILSRFKGVFKYLLTPGIMFEELGYTYIGPVDGYDFDMLEKSLQRAKEHPGPIFLHVLTEKGRGYEPAISASDKFHGVGSFEIETGHSLKTPSAAPTYTEVFSEAICKLAEEDSEVLAITAAMKEGTGLQEFARLYPSRFFDVGIAEQHAVCMAAAMANSGLKPVLAIYSSFLQRAFDQIIHDVALNNLPVIFCIDRSGIVGEDGKTHQGVFDISYLRMIPNMTIMSPCDDKELRLMLEFAAKKAEGPIAIRYPRGKVEFLSSSAKTDTEIEYGKSVMLKDGDCLAMIAAGNMLSSAIKVAEKLKKEKNIDAAIINPRFLKPLDKAMLESLKERKIPIVTMEENILKGGFGSAILEELSDMGASNRLLRLGLPDEFITHGTRKELLHLEGLLPDQICAQIIAFL